MSYAIVGFGKIGQALAHAFARKNIDVTVASRRPPEALAPQARAIGPTVVAKSLRDALEADTIILAVPFGEHREVAKALPSWKGKTVIDAMNALVPPEELDGLPSSAFVAKAFRSRGGLGQTTRVRTRQAGKAQRGWRAGARTRPHLGPAHLPGFVQEGAVIDLRPCDLAREVRSQTSAIHALNDIDGKSTLQVDLNEADAYGIWASTSCKYRWLRAPATTDSCDTSIPRTDVPFCSNRVLRLPATSFPGHISDV